MLGRLLGGRYRIIQSLGSGGFSQTYIAEDTKMYNNRCVVKQLKPQVSEPNTLRLARRLFNSEAEILHKLGNYDKIPQLLAYFEEKQEFYLVQQLIPGHPLNQELTPGKKRSEDYVVNLLLDILQPLAFVHENHVIHRDIKPSNLVRRYSDGKIVLIDFGAVKQISAKVASTSQRSRITVSIGTPGYMPSEQSQGSPRFSSDIYAVGMTAIQALTGLLPEELQQDVHAEITWRYLVNVKTELADVLDRMVRYDFRQRYNSAAEALSAVQELASVLTLTPQSTSRTNLRIHCFGYAGGFFIGFNFLAKVGDWAAVWFWGLAIGVKQWLILRQKVFRPSWLWILTTALSVVIPFFLVGLNNYKNFGVAE